MSEPIHKLAKLLGVTPAMIRKYEKKGLLRIERNEENNYREYDPWSVGTLVRIRQLRQIGLSLEEIDEMINRQSIDAIPVRFELRRQALEREIEERKQLIAALDSWREELGTLGKPLKEVVLPGLRFRKYMSSEGLIEDEAKIRLASDWLDSMPSSFPGLVFQAKRLDEDINDRFDVGVFIPDHLTREAQQEDAYLPLARYIAFSAEVDGDFPPDLFQTAYAYMEAHRLHLCGKIWAKIVWSSHHQKPGRGDIDYRFFIPVECLKE